MLDLKAMNYALLVDELGSFRKAAEQMKMRASMVSPVFKGWRMLLA